MFKVESLIFVITFSPPLQMLAQPFGCRRGGARVAQQKIVKQRLGQRGCEVAQGFGSESVSKNVETPKFVL